MNRSERHLRIRQAPAQAAGRVGEGLRARALSGRAFSLVELLVVMTLLSFIVLGLLAVFSQTQRAFKVGMAQVDVLEGGRAAMDLIVRDVEEMAAITDKGPNTVNLFVSVLPGSTPLQQELTGTSNWRDNVLQTFFLTSRVNQEVLGTGYTVFNGADDGIGTLYRYSTGTSVRNYDAFTAGSPIGLLNRFLVRLPVNPQDTNFSRVIDGVVHFRMRAYGTNGVMLDPLYDRGVFTNILVEFDPNPKAPGEIRYEFRDDTLPTAVEIELGVAEQDVVARARALPAGALRREYLAREVGKVHVFKQRVPIRRANPKVYQQ